jgi:hypothetical protein
MMKRKPAPKKKAVKGKAPCKDKAIVTPKRKTNTPPEHQLLPENKVSPAHQRWALWGSTAVYSDKEPLNPNYEPSFTYIGRTHPLPSIECVATLAGSFITSGQEKDHIEAVETALRLFDLAAEGVESIRAEVDFYDRELKEINSEKTIKFVSGCKRITGQKRADRAKEYLQDFWSSTGISKKVLYERISEHEKNGFSNAEVKQQRMEYTRWRKKII